MPILPINISKEITDKYSIENNTFIRIAKPNPKDKIEVEVGDIKQPDFLPQMKLKRWNNEVNFSIRLKDTEIDTPKISTLKDKIIWDKGNTQIEFYDFIENEGGYKVVWYLKEKPATNKIEFTIQSKGLNFYYQPPLTQEFQNGYSKRFKREIIVSETQVRDLDGNVLVNRPENVVGSYAVYCSEQKTNWVGGKLYRTGQFGFIYRPHITDKEGKETWGILHIENGIYSVEIPQDFLDNAVYPIKSNDTFGYTTAGGSVTYSSANRIRGLLATGAAGIATSISAYIRKDINIEEIKGLLVKQSDLTIITNGIGNAVANEINPAWKTSSFSTSPSISGIDYYICIILSGGVAYYYNKPPSSGYFFDNTNNFASPTDPTDGNELSDEVTLSFYCTYTPAAAGPANVKSVNGVAIASVKSVNGVAIASVKSINGIT